LEDVAKPLSAESAEGEPAEGEDGERELQGRIQGRVERRLQRERAGVRRWRPGPGPGMYVPAMLGSATSSTAATAERVLDSEIDAIGRAVDEAGVIHRDDLARRVGAAHWGPGRFNNALREAVAEGRIRRVTRHTYGPPAASGRVVDRT
jgi:hypothetical protein